MPISEVYNCDCIEFMRTLPDKHFDLAIADPPYGINRDGQKETIAKNPKHNRKYFAAKGWDKTPPEQIFFDEMRRVSKNQIIWGANHFISKIAVDSPCWLVWDKGQKGLTMGDCELAWTSINKPARIYLQNRVALMKEGTIHPTQKPISLYSWIIDNYGGGVKTIFDPMMGSQSCRIAAYKTGLDFYGCELDKEYFDMGNERFERECHDTIKMKDGTELKQLSLF